MVVLIWQGMCGNGALIGIAKIINVIQNNQEKAPRWVRTTFCVAAPGSTFQVTAVALIATAAIPAIVAVLPGFEWFSSRSSQQFIPICP
jgi:hypothetical protein